MKGAVLGLTLVALVFGGVRAHATDLSRAIEDGSLPRVRAALKSGDVNKPDAEGQDALLVAISTGASLEIVNELLDKGARTDRREAVSQQNILFEAVRLGHPEIIARLLKADPKLLNQTDAKGETALFEAVRASQSTAVRALLDAGADQKIRNKAGKTAEESAHPKRHRKILKVFREKREREAPAKD